MSKAFSSYCRLVKLYKCSATASRDGTGFMADRFTVSRLCDELNSTLCFKPGNFDTRAGLPHKDFLKMVASYPFIACIHGGGIESSPKAWEALLVGTIPIIQHSTLDDAYERFPVMFVKDWSDVFAPDFHGMLLSHLISILMSLHFLYL